MPIVVIRRALIGPLPSPKLLDPVPRLLAITKALDYRGETVWWARRGTLKLVLGLCWLLALLPAVPMWPGVGDTRRDFNDGSGIYCGFPYGSVRGTFSYYFVIEMLNFDKYVGTF